MAPILLRYILLCLVVAGCATRPDCRTKAQRQQWHARPLAVLERVTAPHSVVRFLSGRPAAATRVLEFGTGEGRVLMELQLRFPAMTFVGLNETRDEIMCSDEDYVATGLHYGDLTAAAAKDLQKIPELVAHDAYDGSLPAGLGDFDLIFSHYSVRYIRDKERLLRSMWEHLRVGGELMLEIKELAAVDPQGRALGLKDFARQVFPADAQIETGVNVFEHPPYQSMVEWLHVRKQSSASWRGGCLLVDDARTTGTTGGVRSHYRCEGTP